MGGTSAPARQLEIELFGEPRLSYGGEPYPLRAPRRAFVLLAYLALHGGEIRRERLAFALWPDAPEELARDNVRRHLHLLAAALPTANAAFRADRRAVTWVGGAAVRVDTADFDSAVDPADAVAHYRGELLAGFDEEWILPLRQRYRDRAATHLHALVRERLATGDVAAATRYGMQLLELDPWREDVVRDLMDVRIAAGDRAGAARLYRELAQRLDEELGVAPTAETAGRYARLGSSEPTAFAATRRAQPIVVPTTSLHGRERDLYALRQLLSSARLVTLVGPGGVGKTRLATELLAHAQTSFADGAAIVDLGPLDDATAVADRVAQVLGIRELPGTTTRAALVADLRERELLLLLDNCEHLVAEVAELVETLVRAATRLRVVVTSREALRIPDETVFRVAPLTITQGPDVGADAVLHSPAVQLFIDRALARDRTLELAAHVPQIARICTKLDGLPLAIELAAMNLDGAGVDALARTVDEEVGALGEGWRTANPRQRTLEAVFAWSFRLMSPDAQDLLLRLSVFRGAFSSDSARVIGAPQTNARTARALIPALAERSMLVAEASGEEARYRMLETVRAFAGEKLVERGLAAPAEREHASYYGGLADRARLSYEELSDDQWLPPLRADADNFTVALERTLGGTREGAPGAVIAAGLTDFWLTVGQESVATRWLEAACAREPDFVYGWLGLAALYRRAQRFAEAIATATRVIPALRDADDAVALSRALMTAGNSLVSAEAATDRAAAERGRAMVVEALEVAQTHGHLLRVAEARFALGIVNDYLGDVRSALREHEEARRLFLRLGKSARAANVALSIALVSHALGDLDRAESIANELADDEGSFNRLQMVHAFELLGTIAFDRGDLPTARARTERALRLVVDTGLGPLVDERLARISRIDAAAGDPDSVRLFAYLRRRQELGAFQRHPRDHAADLSAVAELRISHQSTFHSLWEQGYQATQDEIIGLVLNRER